MKNKIYPCLWFDGQAKAAAELYCSVFSNAKIMADTPLVVTFEIEGRKFMGLNGGAMFKVNPSISFFAMCKTEEEVEQKWKKLSEGGKVMMPLNKYPWSDKYGFCEDRFGVCWQVILQKESGDSIVPCLMFTKDRAGKAEEAIKFYSSVFDNSEVRRIARYEKGEPDVEGYIKYADFRLNGEMFVAMDSSAPHQFSFDEGVSLVVSCKDQEEIDYFWDKLTEGGRESRCGWLKDKFGVSWQVVPEILGKYMSDPQTAAKVIPAFMKMIKFDIAALEEAAQ